MQHDSFEMSGGYVADMSPSLVAPLLALLSLVLGGCATPPDAPDGLDAFLGRDSLTLTEAFASERFPNVVVTNDGTVLATFGTTSVHARRSTDGGVTWGEEIVIADPGFHGGGTTVDRTTGDVLVFVESGHPPAPLTVWRSRDDGLTWSPETPTVLPDAEGRVPSMHMNEHGITLTRGPHAGRLVRPSRWYGEGNDRAYWSQHFTNAVHSDDGGLTWHTSAPFPENGTGEAAVVELEDGTLYYNSRVHWDERPSNTRRRDALSHDAGETWTDWRVVDVLPDGHQHRSYGCMGGLVRLPVDGRDVLIFSNLDTTEPVRERVTVWASFDGGRTWPLKRLVFDGPSAYSSLAAGRPGTASEGWIYLHFEGGPSGASTIARFDLEWILGGDSSGFFPADLR